MGGLYSTDYRWGYDGKSLPFRSLPSPPILLHHLPFPPHSSYPIPTLPFSSLPFYSIPFYPILSHPVLSPSHSLKSHLLPSSPTSSPYLPFPSVIYYAFLSHSLPFPYFPPYLRTPSLTISSIPFPLISPYRRPSFPSPSTPFHHSRRLPSQPIPHPFLSNPKIMPQASSSLKT